MPTAMWQTAIGHHKAAQPSPMKRPKISEAIATDQSKGFRENPCRGIARLAATATKHDLYIALVLRVRDRVFQRIVASILN